MPDVPFRRHFCRAPVSNFANQRQAVVTAIQLETGVGWLLSFDDLSTSHLQLTPSQDADRWRASLFSGDALVARASKMIRARKF